MLIKEPLLKVADEKTLDGILAARQARLLDLIRRRFPTSLRGRMDPEDVLSELCLRAQQRWQHFQERHAHLDAEKRPHDAWLAGLVKDCIIDAYRFHNARIRTPGLEAPNPDDSGGLIDLVSPGTSPSAAFARAETEQRLARVVALLKESDQELLRLRYYEGWPWADVAAVLGLTLSNAGVKHLRVLRRLKDLWKQLYGSEGL